MGYPESERARQQMSEELERQWVQDSDRYIRKSRGALLFGAFLSYTLIFLVWGLVVYYFKPDVVFWTFIPGYLIGSAFMAYLMRLRRRP